MSDHSNKAKTKNAEAVWKPHACRLLTRDEVAELFGLSKRWLEVAASKGCGPPIVRITPKMVRYRAADVDRWIEICTDYHANAEGTT